MSTVADKVLQETRRFREVLPGLLATHRGEWVVFKDGEVQAFHADEATAYQDAVKRFGVQGGYVIAPVVESSPTPVTAAVLFGLSYA